MKRCLLITLLFVIIFLNTKTAQGSVEDIIIENIEVLEDYKEVHVELKKLPKIIGFEVTINDFKITENCRIRRGLSVLVDTLLVIKLLNQYINSSNKLFLLFYDESTSINFTEYFDFTRSNPFEINWALTIGVFVGLALFNIIGYNKMSREVTEIENRVGNRLAHSYNDDNMFVRKIIFLLISVFMFSFLYTNPYFYFPQLISYTWCLLYDIFHYFSIGCFYIALAGFSYHVIQFIFGVQRKLSKNPNVEYTSSIYYHYRKIRGKSNSIRGVLNKEKYPSLWVVGRTALIITIFFTLRIVLLLVLSTLYEFYPSNFMLVLNPEDVQKHSLNLWLDIMLKALIILSIILVSIGSYRVFSKIVKSSRKTVYPTEQQDLEDKGEEPNYVK